MYTVLPLTKKLTLLYWKEAFYNKRGVYSKDNTDQRSGKNPVCFMLNVTVLVWFLLLW